MSHPRLPAPSDRPGAAVRTRICSVMQRSRTDERGIAMATVALIAFALLGVSAVTFSRTTGAIDRVSDDRVWEQSLFVAETGIDTAMDRLNDDASFSTGHTIDQFVDRAAVVALADAVSAADVILTPEGDVVILKPGDATVIYAVGYTPGRDAANREVRVLWAGYEPGTGWTIGLPDGALVANGSIAMTGTTDTYTITYGMHRADAFTNQSFTGVGTAQVDGWIKAAGSVSLSGGAGAYWDAIAGHPTFEVPDAAERMAFQQALLAEATGPGSTTISGDVTSSMTITAPAYITGDIRLGSSRTLTIDGSGTVYVAGSITLSAQASVLNGAGVLAAAGTITQTGQTEYNATGDLREVGLVSFATAQKAITMVGGSESYDQGVVWAVNGGIDMSGGASFTGALIATGVGADGIINMSGGAAVNHIPRLVEDTTFGPTPAPSLLVRDIGEM
jgi:hypothetical protein